MKVFIGHDQNETVARHVLAHSLERRSSMPVEIASLRLSQLPLTRGRDPKQSTDFAFSRFLVPWLCGYKGMAVFLDCDMLCRADILHLFFEAQRQDAAVSVVQHDYKPKTDRKFLDQEQTWYPKKNWSSVMVFDNARCRVLTPELVNKAGGLFLHQFDWLRDEAQIGVLDPAWNHLVGEYDPNPNAKLVHYTLGTPCFAKYANCEYGQDWRDELTDLMHHNRHGEFSLPIRASA